MTAIRNLDDLELDAVSGGVTWDVMGVTFSVTQQSNGTVVGQILTDHAHEVIVAPAKG